jgi:serine/threonine protein kinase
MADAHRDSVAVKRSRTSKGNRSIQHEHALLHKLIGPNIIRMHYGLVDAEQRCVALCLERALGTLRLFHHYIKENPTLIFEFATTILIPDLLEALEYLRQLGIVHCDIKPENILVCWDPISGRPVCKLSDFGTARMVGIGGANCTYAYLSPEHAIHELEPPAHAMDIYSGGVSIFELLNKMEPFFRGFENPETEVEQFYISGGSLPVDELLGTYASIVPDAALKKMSLTLGAMLEVDPSRRFDALQLLMLTESDAPFVFACLDDGITSYEATAGCVAMEIDPPWRP